MDEKAEPIETVPELLDRITNCTQAVALSPRQAENIKRYILRIQGELGRARMEVRDLKRRTIQPDHDRIRQLDLENAKLVAQVVGEEARANALQKALDRLSSLSTP